MRRRRDRETALIAPAPPREIYPAADHADRDPSDIVAASREGGCEVVRAPKPGFPHVPNLGFRGAGNHNRPAESAWSATDGIVERFFTLSARGELRRPFRRLIVIVAPDANPSFDYYFSHRLRLWSGLEVEVLKLSVDPRRMAASLFDDALVLFCRYVSWSWIAELRKRRVQLAGVALFLDDDLGALLLDNAVPAWLRARYLFRGVAPWRSLVPELDLLFVSNPRLARRFPRGSPIVVPPIPDEFDLSPPSRPDSEFVIGYHATHTHFREHDWLIPVVKEVLARDAGVTFQITAAGLRGRVWRGDERVRVLPVRPWPEYRAETRSRGVDLLLAPLLPSRANYARSSVKRIDAARCGAALLVSDETIYGPSAVEEALGMIVPLDAATWVARVLSLVEDRPRARRLAALNREAVIEARRQAWPLFRNEPNRHGESSWRLACVPVGAQATELDASIDSVATGGAIDNSAH
jgi:hypothetical protein